MLDLFEQLMQLTAAFEQHELPYALCGGLAVAVQGHPRGTIDIDILVLAEDILAAKRIAAGQGFDIESRPMAFADGEVTIERVVKLFSDSEEYIVLDLLLAKGALAPIFALRERVEYDGQSIRVLNPAGLIQMKRLRASPQDLADIHALEQLHGTHH